MVLIFLLILAFLAMGILAELERGEEQAPADAGTCPCCGQQVEGQWLLCPRCQAQVTAVCPDCGQSVASFHRYCPHCGRQRGALREA